jgi:hypothetical protein
MGGVRYIPNHFTSLSLIFSTTALLKAWKFTPNMKKENFVCSALLVQKVNILIQVAKSTQQE